jgi:hypothetical protein
MEIKKYLTDIPEIDYEQMLWEILADIYAYVFGFVLDIETNIKNVTEYLAGEFEKGNIGRNNLRIEKYLLRLHVVHLFHETYEDDAFEDLNDPIRIQRSIETLIKSDVYIQFKKRTIEEHKEDNMNIFLSHFSYLLDYCNRKLSKYRELIKDKKEYANSKEVDSILEQLKKGYVYEGEVKHPEVLIYRYTRDNIDGYKSDVALIMTFWNIYIKQRSDHNAA